jgi:hypothetical protein
LLGLKIRLIDTVRATSISTVHAAGTSSLETRAASHGTSELHKSARDLVTDGNTAALVVYWSSRGVVVAGSVVVTGGVSTNTTVVCGCGVCCGGDCCSVCTCATASSASLEASHHAWACSNGALCAADHVDDCLWFVVGWFVLSLVIEKIDFKVV